MFSKNNKKKIIHKPPKIYDITGIFLTPVKEDRAAVKYVSRQKKDISSDSIIT